MGLRQIHAGILEIPDGAAGTRETLKAMAKMVRLGLMDPQMRMLALSIVSGCPGKRWMTEIRAIFNWVRQNIDYRLDATEIEQICLASITIEYGQGDCDDMAIVLATLLMSVGHPCRLVAVGFGEPGDGQFSHVYLQTRGAGEGSWLSLDATEPYPMGWFAPNATNIMRARIGSG